ncbi:protein split ends-like [Uranotaenia lowii]|uniref:protein split ends-like n=1 Tax=Uranotaenia lowii TaxID=190385 RepID=UPI0024799B0E|nr:protein split ends-like [Uranotaenia lowii]
MGPTPSPLVHGANHLTTGLGAGSIGRAALTGPPYGKVDICLCTSRNGPRWLKSCFSVPLGHHMTTSSSSSGHSMAAAEVLVRYGRVQSVRIITTPAYNPTSSGSAALGHGTVDSKEHTENGPHQSMLGPPAEVSDGHGPSGTSSSSSSVCASASSSSSYSAAGSAEHSTDFNVSSSNSNCNVSHKTVPSLSNTSSSSSSGNSLVLSVCATIAFMDIKSASKAHTAEHKFDDRILTTEYYEPSLAMPPTVALSTVSGNNANCGSTTPGDSSSSNNSNSAAPSNAPMQKHASNNGHSAGNPLVQYSSSASSASYLPMSGSVSMSVVGSNSCSNGSSVKAADSLVGKSVVGHGDEHGTFYDCSNGMSTSSSCSSSSSKNTNFNRIQQNCGGALGGDENPHVNSCSSASIGSTGGNGRRMSASSYSTGRDQIDGAAQSGGAAAGNNRSRQRDRQHYRNGPYSTLPDSRSNPVGHHRVAPTNWYGTASGDTTPNAQQASSGSGSAPPTPTRNVYANPSDTIVNPGSSTSSTVQPSTGANTTSTIGERAPGFNVNNNSYESYTVNKKQQKSCSSDSESPSEQGTGRLHQQASYHQHPPHHQRHTSPISATSHNVHYHHHYPSGHHHNNTATGGHSSTQSTHNSRADRSNSRSRSHSPSSSCSSTNSTTTSQSNETSSTTRSPANSSGIYGSHTFAGREVTTKQDRIDRDFTTTRGCLQSAVAVGGGNCVNNNGNSSGASNSSGSGASQLNCHSDDNRPLAICVRNLPARSSDTSLKDGLFHEYKKHGKVTWVKVVGQSTDRYALVCFKKPEDVEKALEVSQDKLFFGCKIEVAPYHGYDVDDNEFRPYEAELDEFHPKSTRTLFIGNLEKDITANELRKHFDCFGDIIEIDIKKQGVSAYAFCQYSDIISVVKAMRKMDGEHLGTNRIKLGFGKSMPTNCVWIDGIADSVGEGYLKSQFDHFGVVSQVTIDRERKLALVFFEQVQCAQVAVKEMRGATLRGRKLQVDFASRECQDAFFDKLDKQTNPAFGSPRFESGSGSRYSNSRYVESSGRSRAASFSRPGNPLSHSGGAVSPRLDPSPVSLNRGPSTANATSRSRIVRYLSDDYYLDSGSSHSSSNERRFRNYDEYSQGSAASSHEDGYEHENYRNSAHDRLHPATTTSDSPPPSVASSGLSSSIQSRLGEVDPGVNRKRTEKSSGDIRYLQKERVHILEQLEECPSSGDELVSPKKRIKYNSDAHQGGEPSDHHHPHYSSSTTTASTVDASSSVCDPSMSTSGGSSGHHHYNSSTNNSNSNNHYNSHHHHHHHSSSDSNMQSGFSSSSASHHRKCVEARRLSDCNLQQSKPLASQTTPSSMHSNNNSRRPSTDSTSMHQRHCSSSSSSSSSLQQSHLDSGHMYPHSLSKRRKTILNSDNSMTVIASAGSSSGTLNEHHHSSRGRGHQLHSLHSHEASGGESADGSRPGTPLCDERPENLPPSEPRRMPTSRSYNQEPMSLPLPRFAIQFLQQYRMQNQTHSSSNASAVSASSTSSSNTLSAVSSHQSSSSLNSTLTGSTTQQLSVLNTLSSAASSGAVGSFAALSSNSSLLANTLSSPPPTHASKLSLLIPPPAVSGSNTGSGNISCSTTNPEIGNQAPASPLRAPSVSSNSSDSEAGPSTSPSLEERMRRLDEMYEKWSGNSSTRLNNAPSEPHFSERPNNYPVFHHNHIGGGNVSSNQSPISNVSSSSASSFRHKFLELDVHEVPPSDIVKSVLSRKSIFDEDLKRLENIGDKYEPGTYSKPASNVIIPLVSAGSASASPVNTFMASQSPLHALKAQTPPATNVPQRIGSCSASGSPMNSPQPYNSPNPSVKSGLQYPFPSHPPSMPSIAVTSSVPSSTSTTTTVASVTPTVNATSNTGTVITTTAADYSPNSVPSTSWSVTSNANTLVTSVSSTHATSSSCYSSGAATTATTTVTSAASTSLCGSSSSSSSSNSSSSATQSSKPKTNVFNKSISLTEKASTNISNNNNNNLTSNSNNQTSTSGSSYTSVIDTTSIVAGTVTTVTTTSITTPKVSSTISSSSSSSSSTTTSSSSSATDIPVTSYATASSLDSNPTASTNTNNASSSRTSSTGNSKSIAITAAPPGSTNAGTIRTNCMPPSSNAIPTEVGLLQHSSSSNSNNHGTNTANEKEEKSTSGNAGGGRHHKDRRKLSTASSCSTSSTGSNTPLSTPSTSTNVLPSLPGTKSDDAEEDDSSYQQSAGGSSSSKHAGKSHKLNHHHHSQSHNQGGQSFRHSSDSGSSSASTSANTKGHYQDDMNPFDRLKREAPLNNALIKVGSSSKKHSDREEKEKKHDDSRTTKEKDEPKPSHELKEKEYNEHRKKGKSESDFKEHEDRSNKQEKEYERNHIQKDCNDFPKQEHDGSHTSEESNNRLQQSTIHDSNDPFSNHIDHRDRINSMESNASARNNAKRRLSSQDSNESPSEDVSILKKHKQNNHDLSRNFERRDSGKEVKKEKFHKSHSRSEKSSKSSSVSSSSSEKFNVFSGNMKLDIQDENPQHLAEERLREMVFSAGEEQVHTSHHHKKKDRYHEKHHKSKKDRDASKDKENAQSANFSSESYVDHRSTSEDDEQARAHHKKERKSSKEYSRRYHSGESGTEYKKYERKHSRAESSADEEGKKKKSRINNNRMKSHNSSDTDDSDEPKKHSIFDIPDDGPNISMYDKVKARSCKNMQKQEEEKKIKAKFSKLKQSRAKREGKNRSKSWDEDSDTEGMNSDTTINSRYNHKDHHNKSGTITTSDDEDRVPMTPRTKRHPKESMVTDSEDENSRIRSNRNRLSNLCDDESSEGDHMKRLPHTPRRGSIEKKMSRINSRSTSRIQSDSETDDGVVCSRGESIPPNCEKLLDKIKNMSSERKATNMGETLNANIKQEIKREEDNFEESAKINIKVETKVQPPSALITSDVSDDEVDKKIVKEEIVPDALIKKEPLEEEFDYSKHRLGDDSKQTEPITSATVASAEIENTVNSAVDQLMYGHSETKKKHKKKPKRHKTVDSSETDIKSERDHSSHEDGTAGTMFDELKKNEDQMYLGSKKKHGGKKDKRRDRSKDDYEKSGKSRKSKSKHKENKIDVNAKREDKMEDIFGPISDEESQHSSIEADVSIKVELVESEHNSGKQITQETKPSVEEPCEMTEKEKSKEESRKRKERKRRERERVRAAMAMKEEDNSVDLDEAGRALEAQLMSDSDQKIEDASPTSTVTTSGKRSSVDVMDVFRFTDGDDSMENSFNEKKESEHGRKEKKKKKKRGKDEKHKHHSHHSNSSSHTTPPISTLEVPSNKLSLDIMTAQQEETKHSIGRELACSTPTKDVEESNTSDILEEAQQNKTNDTANNPTKKKADKLIPGFGLEIDEQLHAKAVLSISGEFITEASSKEEGKTADDDEKQKLDDLKLEEKSRAVISQEETEDAVAALLGESFGTSNTPDFSIDFSLDQADESSSQQISEPPHIPEEDDEEMKKAILSLNTEEHIKLDIKPDTPQSDHDLQIDTDAEDQADDDHPSSLLRFDNPPKTPDVDLSQIGKPLTTESSVSNSAPNSTKKDDKMEMPDTPGKSVSVTNSSTITTPISSATTSFETCSPKTPNKSTDGLPGSSLASSASTSVFKNIEPSPVAIPGQSMKNITTGSLSQATPIPSVSKTMASPIQAQTNSLASNTQNQNTASTQNCHPYTMPPTISIPDAALVYQSVETGTSPKMSTNADMRLQSPKVNLQVHSPYANTPSPTTATSPNLLRPHQNIQNRQSPQLSPVTGPLPVIIHPSSSQLQAVTSNSVSAKLVPSVTQPNSRFPIVTPTKSIPPPNKTNEQTPIKQAVPSVSNNATSSAARSLPSVASTPGSIGLGNVGSTVPISTTYVIHNPNTPTKTIVHQQQVYPGYPLKPFVQSPPQSNEVTSTQDVKPAISTITTNPNHSAVQSLSKLDTSNTSKSSDTEPSKVTDTKIPTDITVDKSGTNEISQATESTNKPTVGSLLTEENVSKISESVVLGIDQEDQEGDSKEDSDYWSAKDTIIDSVIKKVDALCSEDDASDAGGSEANKDDWNKSDTQATGDVKESSSSVTIPSKEPKSTLENSKAESIPMQSLSNIVPSTQPAVVQRNITTVDIGQIAQTEEEHPDEIFSEGSAMHGPAGRGGKRGGRRGGRKNSESLATPVKAPVSSVDNKTPEGESSKRGAKSGTKRGRGGRGGGRGGANVHPGPATGSRGKFSNNGSDVYEFHDDSGEEVAVGDKQQQDVNRPRLVMTIKNQLTTSPPTSATNTFSVPVTNLSTTVTNVTSSGVPIMHALPVQMQPTTSCPVAQPPVEAQSLPAPATDTPSKEDFVHPAGGNTRKSRRLLEKDGRTTVDDIIDAVIRNGPSPKEANESPVPSFVSTQQQQHQQQQPMMVPGLSSQPMSTISISTAGGVAKPPVQGGQYSTSPSDLSMHTGGRRNTRQNLIVPNAVVTDARKSPRSGRKGKDRKISETSVDSSDEKSVGIIKPSQLDVKNDEQSVAGTLSATTPITPSLQVTRPNETASLADKSKEKPKQMTDMKQEFGPTQQGSLTLIDPVTGELTMMRTSKEGQYLPIPNAPQPLKKVIAAAATAAQSVEQFKSNALSPTPPISASPSPIPNRTPTPGAVHPQVVTRVPTPNTSIAQQHQPQPIESNKMNANVMGKQTISSQNLMMPSSTIVVPSGQNPGTVVIQHQTGSQHPTVVQQVSSKPHTLKAHMLNAQQVIQHQNQNPTTPTKSVQPPPMAQQQQIIYKSTLPTQQIGMPSGAIHTTTGKQIHPSPNIKVPGQTISQPTQQQIIIQNPISQQNAPGNKPGQPLPQAHHPTAAMHHPPGSGNLLINIPQNLHQMGNVPMSPRMPQHHQVLVTNTKGPSGAIQVQSQPNPQQVIHRQPGPPQTLQSGQSNQTGSQQIIIHSGKAPPGHQITAGYTTVLQTGAKIIHQGPVQLSSQQTMVAQPQQHPIGKHTTQTIQISSNSGVPIHYQGQVHKTVTTVHGGQQVKIQQHKVGPEVIGHMQQQQVGHLGNKTMVQHTTALVGSGGKNDQPQIITQNHSVGLTKINHVVSGSTSSSQQIVSGQQGQPQLLTIQQSTKGVSPHLQHQAPQILTGAVASPPLKQPHMQSQQPVVAGASSSRVAVPPISPQGAPGQTVPPNSAAPPHLRHAQQGLNVPPQVAYDANPHGDISTFISRGQSPPPAHQQQTSPITPVHNDAVFRGGMPRDYVKYVYNRGNIQIPSRSPMLPGSVEQRDISEIEESVAASPPLELRRPSSGPRPLTVPHSLQSPGDRSTDSPQVYMGSARIPPHSYSDTLNTRFYDPGAGGPSVPPRAVSTEPPPAHRPHNLTTSTGGFPPGSYPGTPSQTPPPVSPANLAQPPSQSQQRDRVAMTGHAVASTVPLPAHSGGLPVPLNQPPSGRNVQVATPPTSTPSSNNPKMTPSGLSGSAPTPSDSLDALLQRYPVMWQGLLALKNDQAAVQMHFVHGNPGVAGSSLPSNGDGTTPPLRIAQRMRLEPAQIDGVARKMQMDQEHCMLLALPCGRDRMDVLQQQNNLQTGFITYLQQKQAAGIVNIAAPGSSQAAYVVHIFPSCEFANENLARIAPDLMRRVANIQYLLIVIATV